MSIIAVLSENAIRTRLIPFSAIEFYNGAAPEEFTILIQHLDSSSTWSIEPVTTENDTGGVSAVAYLIQGVAYSMQNDWQEQRELLRMLDLFGITDMRLYLDAHAAQPGRGEMIIQIPQGKPLPDPIEIRDLNVTWKIPSQQGPLPKVQFIFSAMLSIDALAVDGPLRIFRQQFGW